MSKNMCKIYDVHVCFKRNWKRKAGLTVIFSEIWKSHPEFWKVVILKKIFGKFLKNCLWQGSCDNVVDTQIAIEKGFQQLILSLAIS